MLMVHEKHPKIGAAGSENGFVCLEVNVIDCNATVTEKAPLSLVVELLQDVAAVAGLRHLPSVEDRPQQAPGLRRSGASWSGAGRAGGEAKGPRAAVAATRGARAGLRGDSGSARGCAATKDFRCRTAAPAAPH